MSHPKDHRPSPSDRRHYTRFSGKGLVASISATLVEVIDISMGGAKIAAGFPNHTQDITFILIPRVGKKLMLNDGVRGTGTIVKTDADAVSIQFNRVSYNLAKLIVRHTSEALGVQPFMVK